VDFLKKISNNQNNLLANGIAYQNASSSLEIMREETQKQ